MSKQPLRRYLNPNAGATLLEMALVLAIILVMVAGSLRIYNYHRMQMISANLGEQLDQITQIANHYYYAQDSKGQAHCLDEDLASETHLHTLLVWAASSHLFLPQQLAKIQSPPWQLQFTANSTEPLVYTFQISLTLANYSLEQLQFLQTNLQADSTIQNKTLTWTRMPSQLSGKTYDDSLWVANNDLRNFANQNHIDDKGTSYKKACPA